MGLSLRTVEDQDRYARLLIYGAPGAGKTSLAATAPNPVWLDFENSTEALRKSFPTITVAGTAKELAQWDDVLKFILDLGKTDYETIVIDTISSMNLAFMTEWMRQKFKANSSADRHIARQPDFRKVTNVMREIFLNLIQVEKHVVLIAHEKYLIDQDAPTVIKQIRPSLPPAAESSVEQLVNECFYLEKKTTGMGAAKKVTRTLTISSEGKIFAKNRQGFEQTTIDEPTWEKIYKWD